MFGNFGCFVSEFTLFAPIAIAVALSGVVWKPNRYFLITRTFRF